MKAFPLYEGSFSVDQSKKFIPFDPAVHEAKDRPASLFIYVQPFLIDTGRDLILLDTGLGYSDNQGNFLLHQHIRNAGYEPGDVSLVLMSHLHFDHAGGMVRYVEGKMEVSFPNAEYVIQRGEWELAYSKPSLSYKTEIFDVLQRSNSIHFVEGNGQLNEQISYQVSGGHTQHHQVFTIRTPDDTFFFGGDVLPEPEQLIRRFAAKYDFDGRHSMAMREEYGKEAASNDWICLFYHAKTKAMAKVSYVNESFGIIPV